MRVFVVERFVVNFEDFVADEEIVGEGGGDDVVLWSEELGSKWLGNCKEKNQLFL